MVISTLAFTEDQFIQNLQVFCVGGAVRDALLGQTEGDRDWVVVGASPEEMLARGFTPVGGDFPVFLHPKTHQEYALARTERKSGRGYQGFTFYTGKDVSLAEDLQRRDFTINAMATDSQGVLYDPYGGLDDLKLKLFRHVGEAFIEDPVRILRLARFLSRFSDFNVAPKTFQLCQQMVENHEVDALVSERVWKEISRALMAEKPSRCFEFLSAIGALPRVMPSLRWRVELSGLLDQAAVAGFNLSQRYALLSLGVEDDEGFSKHLRVAREQADYAKYLPAVIDGLGQFSDVQSSPLSVDSASSMIEFVERIDGIRKPERLLDLIAVAIIVRDEPSLFDWQTVLATIKAVPVGEIAQQCQGDVTLIKERVKQARIHALLA
ncbi:MAG: CCA tRNA nucleotidyltransferase [Pelistega sp.]|nr:CCA tRNA nucleotidyltransferase [Pelistega sp.]